MGIIERTYGKETNAVVNELLISSDTHVIEPAGLWQKQLPKAFQNRAPDYGGQRPNDTPGGAQDKNQCRRRESARVISPRHRIQFTGFAVSPRRIAAAVARRQRSLRRLRTDRLRGMNSR